MSELHDLLELVNIVAPEHSNAKSELIQLLVVWDNHLDKMHDFLEQVYEHPEWTAAAKGTLQAVEQLRQGTRWGNDERGI